MKAKMPEKEVSNATNYGGNKELTERLVLVAFKKGEFRDVVDARFYMGRSQSASVVYCSVWIRGDGKWWSGKGNAGGYGYHRASAALGSALSSAGIELYGSPYLAPGETRRVNPGDPPEDFKNRAHIDGCGSGSMRAAVLAIGVALGYSLKQLHIVE